MAKRKSSSGAEREMDMAELPRSGRAPTPLANSRRMKILEWLQEEGSARVRELSSAFGVSEVTIRLDLERLEAAFPLGVAAGDRYPDMSLVNR